MHETIGRCPEIEIRKAPFFISDLGLRIADCEAEIFHAAEEREIERVLFLGYFESGSLGRIFIESEIA